MKSKIKFLCFLFLLGTVACQQEDIISDEQPNIEIENRNTPCSHCAFVVSVEYKVKSNHGNCCLLEFYSRVEEPCGQQFYINGQLVQEAWVQDVSFDWFICGEGPHTLLVLGANEFDGDFNDVCGAYPLSCDQ
ncbi:MAG: hypothetical protein HKN09_04310 [Saprospiraceae bacterium]|nr:hypothetical protein [Saprospiraceae bacterium]